MTRGIFSAVAAWIRLCPTTIYYPSWDMHTHLRLSPASLVWDVVDKQQARGTAHTSFLHTPHTPPLTICHLPWAKHTAGQKIHANRASTAAL